MITEKEIAAASVPTPAADKKTLFLDTDGEFKTKDESGTVESIHGAAGATGAQGDPGEGVPAGGTAGQVLEKIDGTDYNTQWVSKKLDDLAAPDDNTDLDVSTSAHGLAPKLPNDATKYLDGTGNYSVPAGGGGGGSGAVVQMKNTQTGAVATGSTLIPHDDTIPQNTEGDEYMTLAITPTSATNKLRVDVVIQLSPAGGSTVMTVALFQDSTADALAAIADIGAVGTGSQSIALTHFMTAGTTSPTTFKVRAGGNAGTLTFNGQSGVRRYGGVCASSITITEIVP